MYLYIYCSATVTVFRNVGKLWIQGTTEQKNDLQPIRKHQKFRNVCKPFHQDHRIAFRLSFKQLDGKRQAKDGSADVIEMELTIVNVS